MNILFDDVWNERLHQASIESMKKDEVDLVVKISEYEKQIMNALGEEEGKMFQKYLSACRIANSLRARRAFDTGVCFGKGIGQVLADDAEK